MMDEMSIRVVLTPQAYCAGGADSVGKYRFYGSLVGLRDEGCATSQNIDGI